MNWIEHIKISAVKKMTTGFIYILCTMKPKTKPFKIVPNNN